MHTRDLLIFKTVADLGSINKAAQHLNYVQSNVTTRIQKLEQQLNTQLFHRHKRGITLTNEGKELLPYARKIVALVEEMKAITKNEETPSGKLEIASVETVIRLPLILSRYIEQYKDVDLTLSTGVTAELVEKVLNYQLDGAFVTKSNATNDPRLEGVEVFNEKLVLITNDEEKSLDEILQMPLLQFSDGCGYRAKLLAFLTDHNIVPTKIMELGTLETTLGSVISGLGVAYVPYSAVEEYIAKKQIRYYELPDEYSLITTIFIYRKTDHITPALKKFIETIKLVRSEQYDKV